MSHSHWPPSLSSPALLHQWLVSQGTGRDLLSGHIAAQLWPNNSSNHTSNCYLTNFGQHSGGENERGKLLEKICVRLRHKYFALIINFSARIIFWTLTIWPLQVRVWVGSVCGVGICEPHCPGRILPLLFLPQWREKKSGPLQNLSTINSQRVGLDLNLCES